MGKKVKINGDWYKFKNGDLVLDEKRIKRMKEKKENV